MAKGTNAKLEFIGHIQAVLRENSNAQLLCCEIIKGDYHESDDESEKFTYRLTTGFTKEEYDEFLTKLDFNYDSGYGSQNLFGIIWYKDGTWSERGEYDGSEWYQYQRCPEIPINLKRLDKEREEKLNHIL